MDINLVKKSIEKIGAPVSVEKARTTRRFGRNPEFLPPATFDVKKIKGKETVLVTYNPESEGTISVLDCSPEDRHVLFLLKYLGSDKKEIKAKVLCGHDERHWFSCGVPEPRVSTIKGAKQALMPVEVLDESKKKKVKSKDLLKRKNLAHRRQGEWFFVPAPEFIPPDINMIKKNEPISRGRGSKPHMCEEVYNTGGQEVYFHEKYAPNGIRKVALDKLMDKLRADGIRNVNFTTRSAGGVTYARGYVRHPDHSTIYLPGWHRVYMNTEGRSRGARASVFLD
jgi:hypothetical protein